MVKRACSGVLLSLSVAFSPDEHSCMLLLTNQHDTEVKMGKIKKLVKTLLIKRPLAAIGFVYSTVQCMSQHKQLLQKKACIGTEASSEKYQKKKIKAGDFLTSLSQLKQTLNGCLSGSLNRTN